MGGAELQHHLMLVAEVDALSELALRHAPEVQVVAELAAQQILGIEPVLDHRRRRPLRRDRPCRAAGATRSRRRRTAGPRSCFPRSEHFERVVVEQRDTARSVVAVGATQRRHEDAAGPAMHGVRSRVSRLGGQLAGLNGVFQHRVSRIGLGIEDVGRSTTGSRVRASNAARDRCDGHGLRGTAHSSMRSSRSGEVRFRPSVARSIRPRGQSWTSRGRSRLPRARPLPDRPGRMRQRRRVARALPRRRHRGVR